MKNGIDWAIKKLLVTVTHIVPRRLRSMRVIINSLFCRLSGRLTAPPISVRNEKELFLAKGCKSWKVRVWGGLIVLLPSVECGRDSTCVRNILAQGETSAYMERFWFSSVYSKV